MYQYVISMTPEQGTCRAIKIIVDNSNHVNADRTLLGRVRGTEIERVWSVEVLGVVSRGVRRGWQPVAESAAPVSVWPASSRDLQHTRVYNTQLHAVTAHMCVQYAASCSHCSQS